MVISEVKGMSRTSNKFVILMKKLEQCVATGDMPRQEILKGGSITVLLTSCLTGLESAL